MSEIKDETIEQKILRLEGVHRSNQSESTDGASSRFPFYVVCALVELAIAEEREACKAVCRAVGNQNVSMNDDYLDGRFPVY